MDKVVSFGELREAIHKLMSYDRVLKIGAPGGPSGQGPWSDPHPSSPIPLWNLHPDTGNNTTTIHVMTIGKPVPNLETNEEERRIKIYEHTVPIPENLSDISVTLSSNPTEALRLIDPLLRHPQTVSKITDKILTRKAAISALASAQIGLLPLFGNWVNSLLCNEVQVLASSTNIYLCGYCPENGTVARVLKPLDPNSTRKQVKQHLTNALASVLDIFWENHPQTGFSLAVVVPPGVKGDTYFH